MTHIAGLLGGYPEVSLPGGFEGRGFAASVTLVHDPVDSLPRRFSVFKNMFATVLIEFETILTTC